MSATVTEATAARTAQEVTWALHDTATAYWVVDQDGVVALVAEDRLTGDDAAAVLGLIPAVTAQTLGSAAFRSSHGVGHAWMSGAMAGGIASEKLVVAMARAGFLAAYGCAGLLPDRVERGIASIVSEIGSAPFACNLIHSPSEPALERAAIETFLRHGVAAVEASAFMDISPTIVRYRAAGLTRGPDGQVDIAHRVIAKVSRPEVAEKFMRPAPDALLDQLVAAGHLTETERDLARLVPVADDVTVEADSGGHTDNRPLGAVLPTIVATRDRIAAQLPDLPRPRVGAAGGIGTPEAAAAAFAMGADYVVTGSVNQACREAGTSPIARELLAKAGVADFAMAPAADMFELGVELQVLQRGTMFPQRAKLLHTTYQSYAGLDDLPTDLRARLEKQVFGQSLTGVWDEVRTYFARRDPAQLERAEGDPKRRMALVFRWYLGMASRWATVGEAGRAVDFQIWSGPALGSFNAWAAGSWLADPESRGVVEVNRQLAHGAAVHTRATALRTMGIELNLPGLTRPTRSAETPAGPSATGGRR